MKLPAWLPLDKVQHLVVGAVTALLAFVLWHLAMLVPWLAAHPAAAAVGIAGTLVGAAKEAEDRLDNLWAWHQGLAPMHGVEWLDLVATAAGAWLVALGLVRLGVA